jgi:hypothetical protein
MSSTSPVGSTPNVDLALIPNKELYKKIDDLTVLANKTLAQLQANGDNVSVEDLFKAQELMNQLSDYSTESTRRIRVVTDGLKMITPQSKTELN